MYRVDIGACGSADVDADYVCRSGCEQDCAGRSEAWEHKTDRYSPGWRRGRGRGRRLVSDRLVNSLMSSRLHGPEAVAMATRIYDVFIPLELRLRSASCCRCPLLDLEPSDR